jgi:hypothetical protein
MARKKVTRHRKRKPLKKRRRNPSTPKDGLERDLYVTIRSAMDWAKKTGCRADHADFDALLAECRIAHRVALLLRSPAGEWKLLSEDLRASIH